VKKVKSERKQNTSERNDVKEKKKCRSEAAQSHDAKFVKWLHTVLIFHLFDFYFRLVLVVES